MVGVAGSDLGGMVGGVEECGGGWGGWGGGWMGVKYVDERRE